MDQALGQVSQERSALLVHLLGVESDVVCEADELVHQLGGLVGASGAGERVGEPERAAQEGALASRKAVLAAVAIQQRAVAQLASHGRDRGGHLRVAAGGIVHQAPSRRLASSSRLPAERT